MSASGETKPKAAEGAEQGGATNEAVPAAEPPFNRVVLPASNAVAGSVLAPEPAPAIAPTADAVDPIHAGELAIAGLLRWGVVISATLLTLALAGSWIAGVPLGSRLLPLDQLLSGGHGPLPVLAQLGLLTLAVTPLARVALAAGVFARAGEKRQTWISVGVLALLAVALLLGAVEG